jgi:sugar lactone lactonase YvrE
MDARKLVTGSELELVLDCQSLLGEGPCWDHHNDVLVWVDIDGNSVHRFNPGTGKDESFRLPDAVGAAVPRASGGMMLAIGHGFSSLDLTTGAISTIAEPESGLIDNRMNDGKCDSRGRFWAGTLDKNTKPGAGALYCLDVDRRVTKMVDQVTISNGLAWSPDDSIMYFIDSATGIDAFDFDVEACAMTKRRRLISIPKEAGLADGMCVDAEGYIWVAMWGGWGVNRYAPDGSPAGRIEVPARFTTSCAFGGAQLTDLYITTARRTQTADELADQPNAGGIFRCSPGVAGLPTSAYAG